VFFKNTSRDLSCERIGCMNNLPIYINRFFDELEVFEDIERDHSYKAYMRQAVLKFLEGETKETAFAVYEAFFDSYRITLKGDSNPFVDLLDVLRAYEENAATLIDKQRDHYIHSVNVFILGLCIFIQNRSYREAFSETVMDKADYPFSYDTRHEEFYYRWGIAALFHDVGYPVEIIGKQIGKFMDFATHVDKSPTVRTHLEFENFESLNTISEVIPKREFIKSYYDKYDSCVYIDLQKPIDLLAHKIHISLDVDLKVMKETLDGFVLFMAKNGFVDHGFYSALIVLKWYAYLIQKCRYKPEYFFYPVLDSASAILLHNFYRNTVMNPPFSKGALSAKEHPIAFLLILCDELQEWNRKAYGIIDKKHTQAGEVSIFITDKRMDITYISTVGILPDRFDEEKEELFNKLLDMKGIFADGFIVDCEAMEQLVILSGQIKQMDTITPRPLVQSLEKLAIAVHEYYNQKQLERYPEKPLKFPRFSDLPDSLKYSNLCQVRNIPEKVARMNYEIRPVNSAGEKVTVIPDTMVEALARFEHERWNTERQETGWTYGPVKDVEKKITPYLLHYDDLSEEIKDLDRDTIRNIPEILSLIQMAVFKK
jgi:hypothetical protein